MGTVDDILEHYGVKGMHWGVRRYRSGGGSLSTTRPPKHDNKFKVGDKRQNHASMDSITYRQLHAKAQKHGHHALSNDEIKKLTTRFELEKKYSVVMAEQAKKKLTRRNKASKYVSKLLQTEGNRAVTTVAAAVTTAQVAKALAKNKTLIKLTTA